MRYVYLIILIVGFVSAGTQICIDLDRPSAPASLNVSGDASSRLLVWGASIDEPSCSGIDYYNISLDGEWIGQVDGDNLSFVDNENLVTGKYIYSVYAVDLIGHRGGKAIANEITIGGGSNGNGGSGVGSSYVCVENWSCDEWTDCVGNEMRRLCNDLNKCGTELEKPETYKECGTKGDDDPGLNLDFSSTEPNKSNKNFFSAMTGNVIGAIGSTGGAVTGAFIVLVAGSFVFVRIRKKKKSKK